MKPEIASVRVYHRCGGCKKKQEFVNSGKFRVNANGDKIDVWLIYRCRKCKHTWNLVVYERIRPQKIPAALMARFYENDEKTAAAFGNDKAFLKRNHAELN